MSPHSPPPRLAVISLRDVLYPELDRVQHTLHCHRSCVAPGYPSGKRKDAWSAALRLDTPPPSLQGAIDELRTAYRAGDGVRSLDQARVFPQARAFLDAVRAAGCTVIAVAQLNQDELSAFLDRLGVRGLFDACHGGDMNPEQIVSEVEARHRPESGSTVVIGAGDDDELFAAAASRGWRCLALAHRASLSKRASANVATFASWQAVAAACEVAVPDVAAAAIASFGNPHELERCVSQFSSPASTYVSVYVSVVDDRPHPDAPGLLARQHADASYWEADGELWWSGATNAAIVDGAIHGANTILLLNPDCHIDTPTLDALVRRSVEHDEMVAATVVDRAHPDRVYWAGSRWNRHRLLRWVRQETYAVRPGRPMKELGVAPYATADTGGRGVAVPLRYFDTVGLFDARAFPQYGGDNDFGLRVLAAGLPCLVDPTAIVSIDATNSGQAALAPGASVLGGIWKRLTEQKHGDAVRTNAGLLRRHASAAEFFPSLAYGLTRSVGGYYLRLRRS